MWKQQKSEADEKKLDKLVKDLERNHFLFKPGIKVLAEWDTVSAMGLHIWAPEFSFVSDTVPKCVESAFHAMSIHERRFEFEPMPYRRGYEETHTEKTRTVRQCLFVGCHFDQHAVGKQKPPEDERTLAIEVHWTVRMLQKRIPNGAGCLPGYDLQGLDEDPHGRESGLPHYIWRKRCDSKQQSSPNADSEAILHEFRPSKSESELYKEWSEYDGKEKDRKSHREVYDKRWMNALSELSLKPEPPVLKGRKRDETMREWFRDLYPEINELSEEGTRLESESNPEGTADALGQ
ncbi:uncharacterized protein J4E84_010882 [Alternaria hordeiaustralica]|uniref:uncharacterized protein n=1 Tax=Alternaria hordeiaustralica TaxID=1187925 RepID=UPI0020C57A08|nr:uncharacterized protein J4E84_010882 [Alternaria hordeiaustralica]KAI4673885.1 hypothetical protein J4E84_010882 [Alternaria hordeiaustralica]